MTLAIQLTNVGKRYQHFSLDDINLALPEGQVMGFIGPNGAGKSTTLRIVMGLVYQDRGRVDVLGHAMPAGQAIAKRDVGFVSEDMRLYASATLAWHMGFIASIYPEWDPEYAEILVKRFGLRPGQKLARFSHGERVKATLLLVLARRPRLLVLDEPTTGLDPVARQEVLGSLMERSRMNAAPSSSPPTTRPTWSRSPTRSPSSTAGISSTRGTRSRSSTAGGGCAWRSMRACGSRRFPA